MRLQGTRAKWVLLIGLAAIGVVLAIPVAVGEVRNASQNASYVLSDLEVTYPYDDPQEDSGASTDVAQVTFVAHWPDSGYPGAAQCQVLLKGASGAAVGKADFELNSGTDGVEQPPVEVPVSGAPVVGEGSCNDLTEDVPGAGYFFGSPTKIALVVYDPDETLGLAPSEIPARSEITFDVGLISEGADDEFRTCFLVVTRTDGSVDPPHRYDILGGGGTMTFVVDGAPETIADAQVSCQPLVEGP